MRWRPDKRDPEDTHHWSTPIAGVAVVVVCMRNPDLAAAVASAAAVVAILDSRTRR